MDAFFKRAQDFAAAAAEKSKQLANESYKQAKETAKKSQLLAAESFKKAGEVAKKTAEKAETRIKSLAQELNPNNVNLEEPAVSKEELEEFGITEELTDFVRGINIKTFKDFPTEDLKGGSPAEVEGSQDDSERLAGAPTTSFELTEFQEHHARLVLRTVQEVSDYRYVLCPRRMKESKFWKIYFALVKSHIAPYEEKWAEKQKAKLEEASKLQKQDPASSATSASDLASGAEGKDKELPQAAPSTEPPGEGAKSASKSLKEHDIDAYLMGALNTSDVETDDEAFDPEDFDKLVNIGGANDSDHDGDAKSPQGAGKSRLGGAQTSQRESQTAAISSGSPESSDGVLVEAEPETESHKPSTT